jgi:hypothetical protein
MAFKMKGSPIHKGTAAKPSPMKDFGISAIISAIAAKAALAKAIGVAAISGAASGIIGGTIKSAAKGAASRQQARTLASAKGEKALKEAGAGFTDPSSTSVVANTSGNGNGTSPKPNKKTYV